MLRTRWLVSIPCALGALLVTPVCHAVWPVVDVRAITQLVTQIRTLQQQLDTARAHLAQAQQEFQSITGNRGMERLLAGTARNYLPADWNQLVGAVSGAVSAYGALTASAQGFIQDMAVIPPAELERFSSDERRAIEDSRRSAATLAALAQQALPATSGRFDSIQQLIAAIPQATDQKAILDLQARIGAEQGMLQNEQTKLQVLYQAAQAEEWANRQREREVIAVNLGSFDSRFRPVP
jgi:type IV secretion system protein VirB5